MAETRLGTFHELLDESEPAAEQPAIASLIEAALAERRTTLGR